MLALAATALLGCADPDSPPLAADDLRIYAPLPGSPAAVAYLTLSNNTDERIVVDRLRSPEFAQVEIHESTLEDGVARMRELPALSLAPGARVTLREGGLHLMLMAPLAELALGDPVTLIMGYTSGGEIILRASLESRVALESR